MNHHHLAWTLTCLLTATAFLAPAASAGHVEGEYDLCRDLGFENSPIPACRPRTNDPCASANEYEWNTSGGCPPEGDLSCVAYGLSASLQYGLVSARQGHSEAVLRSWGTSDADASQQEAAVPGVVREGTLASTCSLQNEERCQADATASAADVVLLGGAIRIGALESRVSLDCWTGQSLSETRFTRLEIGGTDYGPIVHAGTVIVLPGVARITVGDEPDPYLAPWGGVVVSATALRVEPMDAWGNPTGLILVGHSAVAWR